MTGVNEDCGILLVLDVQAQVAEHLQYAATPLFVAGVVVNRPKIEPGAAPVSFEEPIAGLDVDGANAVEKGEELAIAAGWWWFGLPGRSLLGRWGHTEVRRRV